MTPDPNALRRVLMNVPRGPISAVQNGVRSVQSLPPWQQVNLNPAMARQMALAAALRQRRGP